MRALCTRARSFPKSEGTVLSGKKCHVSGLTITYNGYIAKRNQKNSDKLPCNRTHGYIGTGIDPALLCTTVRRRQAGRPRPDL